MPASVRAVKPPVHMVGISLFLRTFTQSKNSVQKYEKCFSDTQHKSGVGHSGHVYALRLSLIASNSLISTVQPNKYCVFVGSSDTSI